VGESGDARQRTYERNRDLLLAQDLSNAQSHDKAVLSLSAAALGLSLSMVKWFRVLIRPDLLVWSWRCFVLAIMAVIFSFLIGQYTIGKRLAVLDMEHNETNEETRSCLEQRAKRLCLDQRVKLLCQINNGMNVLSGFAFIVGVWVLAWFASANIRR
jgi:hypothetical protein